MREYTYLILFLYSSFPYSFFLSSLSVIKLTIVIIITDLSNKVKQISMSNNHLANSPFLHFCSYLKPDVYISIFLYLYMSCSMSDISIPFRLENFFVMTKSKVLVVYIYACRLYACVQIGRASCRERV